MEVRTAAANGALCAFLSGPLDSPSTFILRALLKASDGPAMKVRTAAANGALCAFLSGPLDSPSTFILRALLKASDGPAMKVRTAAANGALCAFLSGPLDSPSTFILRALLKASEEPCKSKGPGPQLIQGQLNKTTIDKTKQGLSDLGNCLILSDLPLCPE